MVSIGTRASLFVMRWDRVRSFYSTEFTARYVLISLIAQLRFSNPIVSWPLTVDPIILAYFLFPVV